MFYILASSVNGGGVVAGVLMLRALLFGVSPDVLGNTPFGASGSKYSNYGCWNQRPEKKVRGPSRKDSEPGHQRRWS